MFVADENQALRMPAHFGPKDYDFGADFKVYQKSTSLMFAFETQRSALEQYIPKGFELLVPEVNVTFSHLYDINWLMGGEYRLINVSAPVRFHGQEREVEGSYTLVIWENLTEPILGGREESGMPKIFADIAALQVLPPRYATSASNGGATFLTMFAEMESEVTGSDFEAARAAMSTVNALGWRYLPKLSGVGADLDQFVLYPQGMGVDQLWVGTGTLTWTKPGPLQNFGQRHIINALADLPVVNTKPVLLAKGTTILDPLGGTLLV